MHFSFLVLWCYLLGINVFAFIVYGMDKLKARKSRWRISEFTLLWIAAIGGSVGAWCGMKLWHHKTLHLKFRYGIPLIFLLQIAVVLFLSRNITCL